jgi:transmembrane sensor
VDSTALNYQQAPARTSEKLAYNKVNVPRGGEYQLTLSDGSKVQLNSMSSIRFPVQFAQDCRLVELEGEAYFEVSKTGQPFIVQTKGMKIEVLGTSFNISAYANEEYQTTLVSGSVKVQTENGSNRVLKPSEQACITPGSNQINVRTVDTAFYTSWIHGKINFKDQRLDDIMKTLARWYDMDVVYENEATKELRFGCYVNRYNEITPLVKLLEQTGRVTVTVEGKTIKIFTNH